MDLASEIVNIVFGHTKAKIHQATGQVIQPAIPVVMKNPETHFRQSDTLTQNALEFKCEHGKFWAFTGIKSSN